MYGMMPGAMYYPAPGPMPLPMGAAPANLPFAADAPIGSISFMPVPPELIPQGSGRAPPPVAPAAPAPAPPPPPGPRMLPQLTEEEMKAHVADSEMAALRTFVEWNTNGDPHTQVDYGVYMQLWRWCESDINRKVIRTVLKERLKLPSPYRDKALVLVQLLPATDLPQLLPELKALSNLPTDPSKDPAANPFIASLGASLFAQAEKEQKALDAAKAAKAAAEEKAKWEAWCKQVGAIAPGFEWRPPPAPIDWTWWARGMPIPPEDWWKNAAANGAKK